MVLPNPDFPVYKGGAPSWGTLNVERFINCGFARTIFVASQHGSMQGLPGTPFCEDFSFKVSRNSYYIYTVMGLLHSQVVAWSPQVHFLHADSCLIPRSLLLEVASYPLPSPDYILIDDYWMSFVLSHHLKVPLWKIKGEQ